MKKWIYIIFVFILITACDKDSEKQVKYIISDNNFGFDVNYKDNSGNLIKTSVPVSSTEDIWSYAFEGNEGDIVFVSAIYKNPNDEIKVQILIDGKVYKQGASKNDTVKYVTVSGTIPYE